MVKSDVSQKLLNLIRDTDCLMSLGCMDFSSISALHDNPRSFSICGSMRLVTEGQTQSTEDGHTPGEFDTPPAISARGLRVCVCVRVCLSQITQIIKPQWTQIANIRLQGNGGVSVLILATSLLADRLKQAAMISAAWQQASQCCDASKVGEKKSFVVPSCVRNTAIAKTWLWQFCLYSHWLNVDRMDSLG